jgi:hypothetical protein
MVVPSWETAAFEVVESEFTLEILVDYGGGHERIHFRRSGGSIHGCG